jgi:hypothetical protein
MLKKILLILLITNTCITQCSINSNDTKVTVAAGIIGLGTSVLVIRSLNSSLTEFYLKTGIKNKEKTRILQKALIILIGASIGLYAATVFYPICKDIIDYAYPTEEQKIALVEAGKRYQALKAKIDLKNCLINNRNHLEIDPSGLPTVCKETADAFSRIAGNEKLEEITETFNLFK